MVEILLYRLTLVRRCYSKFIYYETATKFCEIFPLLLTTVHTVKSKGKISQNFVVFSEYMNLETQNLGLGALPAVAPQPWLSLGRFGKLEFYVSFWKNWRRHNFLPFNSTILKIELQCVVGASQAIKSWGVSKCTKTSTVYILGQ